MDFYCVLKYIKSFGYASLSCLVSVAFLFTTLLSPAYAAASQSYNFTNSSDYTFNSSKIEVSGGQAQLESTAGSDWFNPAWQSRKKITIDNSSNSNALTDYQVNVKLDDTNFDFDKALPSGQDLVFTDSDGTTTLDSWVEDFTDSTTESHKGDTVGEYQATSSSTQGWWHFNNSTTTDASSNGNDGTLTGATYSSNDSLNFSNESVTYFSAPDTNNTLDMDGSFTVEAWINPRSLPDSGGIGTVVAKGGENDSDGADNYFLMLADNLGGTWNLSGSQGISFGFEDSSGVNYQVSDPITFNTGTWYHVAGTYDEPNHTLKLYINGSLVATQTGVTGTASINAKPLYVGVASNAGVTSGLPFDGNIDEVRVLNTAVSASQIDDDYTDSQPAMVNTTTPASGSVWVKVPTIPANSTKTIYMYYGLDTTSAQDLKLGLISDEHGTKNVIHNGGAKYGSDAVSDIHDFVDRMNDDVHPDALVSMGDMINGVDHDEDVTELTDIKDAFGDATMLVYYTLGNHDPRNLSKTEIENILGVGYGNASSMYGSVNVGNYHIVILDAEDSPAPYTAGDGHIGTAQQTWLQQDLASSTKPTIVFVHQGLGDGSVAFNPYFDSVPHAAKVDNAATIRSILENNGNVVAVFQGHTHWDNSKVINNIPYIWIGSLTEDAGKEWANLAIYDNRYMVVTYRQSNHTKNFLVWDLVDKKWMNRGTQIFQFFDNFDGSDNQWTQHGTADWDVYHDKGRGEIRERSGSHFFKILESDYLEDPSYIAHVDYNMFGSAGVTGGFVTRYTDMNNFATLYPSSAGDYFAYKHTVGGAANAAVNTNPDSYSTADSDWHTLKMVKNEDDYSLYNDGTLELTGSASDLSDGYFGLFNYQDTIAYDDLYVRKYAADPPSVSVGTEETPSVGYGTNNPTIVPITPLPFTDIQDFTETATKNVGEIKYQLSNDDGATWYWYNSGWTEATGGYTDANTASDVDTHISTFPTGNGEFLFKAYLHSDGTQLVKLDSVSVTLGAPSDTEAPKVTDFTVPATSNSLSVHISTFTASDDTGVTGYLVTESSDAPSASDTGWSGSAQTSYTVSGEGSHTLYAWVKDANGNVSNSESDTVSVTLPDTIAPTVDTFSVESTSNDLSVGITAFTASDDTGVTGYLVTDSSTAPSASDPDWTSTKPSEYTATSEGSKTLYAWVKDAAGHVSTSMNDSVTITFPDTTAPTVDSTSAIPTNTAATLTWATNEAASTKVIYGLTSSHGTATAETDTSPRDTSHSTSITGLLSCTLYHYAVVSTDGSSNTTTSNDATFITTGCQSNTTPSKATSNEVTSSAGGSTSVTEGSNTFTADAPANSTATSSSFIIQIKALPSDPVINSLGYPTGTSTDGVSATVFDVKVIINGDTILDTFDQPITITYHYTDSEIEGLDESTLALYHYHGGAWQPLDGCTIDEGANTITCTTDGFSIFGLFGKKLAVNSGSSSSSVGSSFGSSYLPGYGPNQTTTSSNKANLEEQIAQLLERVKALKVQLAERTGTAVSTTPVFPRDLHKGMSGSDVQALQHWLNLNGYALAQSGVGSLGEETTYFGTLTQNAVIKYQTAKGIMPNVGYFGPITRASVEGG